MSVSITSIGAMLFTLLISFVLPIVLIIVVKRKTGAPVLNAFVGAGIFILFVLILEQILHWLVLSYTPVAQIPAAYILYGCLAAGVFEETGRFFAFTVLKRKEPDTKLGNALMYGVGHGGAEAILLVAGSTASTLFLALLLNVGGIEGLTAGMTGETLATAMEDLTRLTTTSSLLYMMPGLERLVALCLHIALSVLVWMTVTGRLSKIWYPVAILMHAVANLAAMLYQTGIIKSIYLVEGITTLVTTAIVLIVYYLYNSTKNAEKTVRIEIASAKKK